LKSALALGLISAGVLAILGLLLLVYEVISMWLQLRFTEEYFQRFARFTTQESNDYEWLLRRSTKMQVLLGPGGLMDYKPAGTMSYMRGYPLLLNTLPGIIEGSEEPGIVRRCAEMLVRHAGWLQDSIRSRLFHLINPVQWIIRGLEIPGRFLTTLGVLKPSVGEGPIFRLITLVGIAVGIFAMWDPATAFLRSHGIIP
jgi:hypothetical protein